MGDAGSIYEPRRLRLNATASSPRVGRHQPKMSESPTIYVHITLYNWARKFLETYMVVLKTWL